MYFKCLQSRGNVTKNLLIFVANNTFFFFLALHTYFVVATAAWSYGEKLIRSEICEDAATSKKKKKQKTNLTSTWHVIMWKSEAFNFKVSCQLNFLKIHCFLEKKNKWIKHPPKLLYLDALTFHQPSSAETPVNPNVVAMSHAVLGALLLQKSWVHSCLCGFLWILGLKGESINLAGACCMGLC